MTSDMPIRTKRHKWKDRLGSQLTVIAAVATIIGVGVSAYGVYVSGQRVVNGATTIATPLNGSTVNAPIFAAGGLLSRYDSTYWQGLGDRLVVNVCSTNRAGHCWPEASLQVFGFSWTAVIHLGNAIVPPTGYFFVVRVDHISRSQWRKFEALEIATKGNLLPSTTHGYFVQLRLQQPLAEGFVHRA